MPLNENGVYTFPKEAGGALAGRQVTDHQVPLNVLVNIASSEAWCRNHPEEAELVWTEVLSRCETQGITPPERRQISASGPDPMPTSPQQAAAASARSVPAALGGVGLLMPCGHHEGDRKAKEPGSRMSVCTACARLDQLVERLQAFTVDRAWPTDAIRGTLLEWEQRVRNLI